MCLILLIDQELTLRANSCVCVVCYLSYAAPFTVSKKLVYTWLTEHALERVTEQSKNCLALPYARVLWFWLWCICLHIFVCLFDRV